MKREETINHELAYQQQTNAQLRELALFAGAGGGILGGKLLGWRTVCAVEINPFCARRLMQRQNEGHLPPFPIWDDVCTFDGKPWEGFIDVVSGGFPCQDISVAGKQHGIYAERSGLWQEFIRIVGEVRPRYAFMENSPNLLNRGIGRIFGEMVEMGYNCKWGVFSGEDIGAPIERKRLFAAFSDKKDGGPGMGVLKDRAKKIFRKAHKECTDVWIQAPCTSAGMGDGMGRYVDRVSAIGNGQIPAVVKVAWNVLIGP